MNYYFFINYDLHQEGDTFRNIKTQSYAWICIKNDGPKRKSIKWLLSALFS